MSRPLRVTICGYPFEIKWDDRIAGRLTEDDANYWNLGITEVAEQRIVIRATGQGPHQERDTVLHEILHAVVRMTGQLDRFKSEADEKHPDEKAVYAIAGGVLNVLRGNPHLVRYLTEEIL